MHMDKELFEVTLQLRSCGIGEEKSLHESCNSEGTKESAASERISTTSSSFSGGNKEFMSPYAARAVRQEALMIAVSSSCC